ncbi:MAG: hypothetical protein KC964_02585, partial [Candidatus Omnitrophica bacterium]|nr:hypothetical protein [Candidatus Omnitrophota bacterium]
WIRDRLRWREVQPSSEEYIDDTKYDRNAQMQTDLGMKVLQTFHGTPEWAVEEGDHRGRFPADLRIAYRFAQAMGQRFAGTVQGWEPWNEANADNFGGHAIDEMCSYQKACYLGFKSAEPDLTVCWNPCGGINTDSIADAVLRNRTWPYFDVYSIHSYDWPDSYDRLWAPTRRASSGRPIWVTECDRGMAPDPNSPVGDFTESDGRLKAEFIAQSYIHSLAAGSSKHFHFLLHDYKEQHGRVQFGLLRPDLTPRQSYVALATLGRMLNGAKYLGQWVREGSPQVQIHALRGKPDGVERDILVGWSEVPGNWDKRGKTVADWALPTNLRVEKAVDHFGRTIGTEAPQLLNSGAVFLVLPLGGVDSLPLKPREGIEWKSGEPNSVVLQLRTPSANRMKRVQGWTQEHERTLAPGEKGDFEVSVYNFGDRTVKGTLELSDSPTGWTIDLKDSEIELEPMDRSRIEVAIHRPEQDRGGEDNWLEWVFIPQGIPDNEFEKSWLAARIIDPSSTK